MSSFSTRRLATSSTPTNSGGHRRRSTASQRCCWTPTASSSTPAVRLPRRCNGRQLRRPGRSRTPSRREGRAEGRCAVAGGIETSGVEETKAAFARMVEGAAVAAPKTIDLVLTKYARQVRVQLSMGQHARGTKTGSVAPAPPWRITGHLSQSVKTSRARKITAYSWSGEAGPTAIYSRIQELGGSTGWQHRTRLPARPYAAPAWRIVKSSVTPSFKRAWTASTKAALA